MRTLLLTLLVILGLNTTQAQINWCDSLSYSIVVDSTSWNTLTVTGNANGIIKIKKGKNEKLIFLIFSNFTSL